MPTAFDFAPHAPGGAPRPLAEFRGQALLVVNVASRCGFTPQYAGLEALHRRFAPHGFSVLAFPCNQFGNQEPGDDATIGAFCQSTYDVTFPLFARLEVNGKDADPFYAFLKSEKPGLLGLQAIKWNFTKFLLTPDGHVANRYAPATKPETLATDIERVLPEAQARTRSSQVDST